MDTNPLLGTGYESFWLGPRLNLVAQKAGEMINEAHNGYLEVYLNLGGIGVLLLLVLLIAAYRNVCKRELASKGSVTSLTLGLWTVVLFYNLSEAAFKHGLLWLALLLGAIALPEREEDRLLKEDKLVNVTTLDSDVAAEEFPDFSDSSLPGWSPTEETSL